MTRGNNRHVVGPDIHGEQLFSEAQYVANAADVGSMGIGVATSGFASLGTSEVELTANSNRRVLAINNNGNNILYIGPSGISTASMYPVAANSQMSLNITSGIRLYGKTAASTTDIRIIELS